MFHTEVVNNTVFKGWDFGELNYLKYFLISDNNVNVFKTKNAGHNNITIGREEYINKVSVTLEKISKMGVSIKSSVLGFPIAYDDKITDIIKFYK